MVIANGTGTARVALERSGRDIRLVGSLRRRMQTEPFFSFEKKISLQQAIEMLSASGSSAVYGAYENIDGKVTTPATSEKIEKNISVYVTPQMEASFARFLEKYI